MIGKSHNAGLITWLIMDLWECLGVFNLSILEMKKASWQTGFLRNNETCLIVGFSSDYTTACANGKEKRYQGDMAGRACHV